jgi:uncharacterized protein (TIGR02453 family)
MQRKAHFTPDLFRFLEELTANNQREWFLANKERYISAVRDPFLRFIADLSFPLNSISPYAVADPRPSGGSLFRIYRDVRFSEDKSPYKTHAAAYFSHAKAGRNVHAPGFYLHLEPRGCFAAAGLWHPDPSTLNRIRNAIVAQPKSWEKVRRSRWKMEGESLSRPPKGYDPDHRFIEDLKRKDFVFSVALAEEQVCGPRFLSDFLGICRKMSPLVEFLTKALQLG